VTQREIERRLEIARRAILNVRHRKRINRFEDFLIGTTPKEWAMGLVGVLDYIKTGEIDKILLLEIRKEVTKEIAGRRQGK